MCWGTRKRLFILDCRVQNATGNFLHYPLWETLSHAHLIAHAPPANHTEEPIGIRLDPTLEEQL